MAALGTDTGNSVRGPSSHNALVGLRPSLGLMSRTGIVPLRLDRDTPGQRACHSLGKAGAGAGAGAGAVATTPPPPPQLSSAQLTCMLLCQLHGRKTCHKGRGGPATATAIAPSAYTLCPVPTSESTISDRPFLLPAPLLRCNVGHHPSRPCRPHGPQRGGRGAPAGGDGGTRRTGQHQPAGGGGETAGTK